MYLFGSCADGRKSTAICVPIIGRDRRAGSGFFESVSGWPVLESIGCLSEMIVPHMLAPPLASRTWASAESVSHTPEMSAACAGRTIARPRAANATARYRVIEGFLCSRDRADARNSTGRELSRASAATPARALSAVRLRTSGSKAAAVRCGGSKILLVDQHAHPVAGAALAFELGAPLCAGLGLGKVEAELERPDGAQLALRERRHAARRRPRICWAARGIERREGVTAGAQRELAGAQAVDCVFGAEQEIVLADGLHRGVAPLIVVRVGLHQRQDQEKQRIRIARRRLVAIGHRLGGSVS